MLGKKMQPQRKTAVELNKLCSLPRTKTANPLTKGSSVNSWTFGVEIWSMTHVSCEALLFCMFLHPCRQKHIFSVWRSASELPVMTSCPPQPAPLPLSPFPLRLHYSGWGSAVRLRSACLNIFFKTHHCDTICCVVTVSQLQMSSQMYLINML